jgi:IPT/TIG domain
VRGCVLLPVHPDRRTIPLPKSRTSRLLVALLAATSLLLIISGAASAAHLTVGDTAPGPSPETLCSISPFDNLQETVATGFSYEVPAPGVLTSWSTNAAAGEDQLLTFKVFRPLGGAGYEVVAVDGPRELTASTMNTFAISIPVETGDVIGVNDEGGGEHPSACYFETGEAEDEVYVARGNVPVGGSLTFTEAEGTGIRINVSATLLSAPTIASLGPASGSTVGGTSVTITGDNFAEVKSVSFGSAPASSYVVNSEGQITAISPAGSAGSVPLTVTTIAGTATSSEGFTYRMPSPAPTPTPIASPAPTCTVPSVKGMKLNAARGKVKGAHCALGKNIRNKGANNRNGKVVAQSLKPGTIGPLETVVRVTLGKG